MVTKITEEDLAEGIYRVIVYGGTLVNPCLIGNTEDLNESINHFYIPGFYWSNLTDLLLYWNNKRLIHVDAEGNQRYMGTVPDWFKARGVETIEQLGNLSGERSGFCRSWSYDTQIYNRLLDATPVDDIAVECYVNLRDYLRGRKTKMKPGKFFRMLKPDVSDAEVEDFVNKYREMYSEKSYTLHVGTKSDDFEYAYAGEVAPSATPSTCDMRKSLKNSCMQGDFELIEGHPAIVYASGDFTIIYLKDDKDRVAGRCVVYTRVSVGKKPQAGPCYGVDEKSLDMLEAHIEEMGCVKGSYSDWSGAKLLRIETGDNEVLMPYIDISPTSFEECGDGFRLTSCGTSEADSTEGFVCLGNRYHCRDCGDGVDEDELYTSEDGDCYCSCCYNNTFVHDEDGCEIHIDDAIRAFVSTRYGTYEVWMSSYSGDFGECEATGDVWHIDDLLSNSGPYGLVCKEYAEKYMVLDDEGDYIYEKEKEIA
jgi:hypothetical protein